MSSCETAANDQRKRGSNGCISESTAAGTSTKAELHRDGHTERRKYGPFNISAIGEEAFRKLLREMFADWGRLEDCRALCVGGAGVSCGELEQIIREELKPTGFTESCCCAAIPRLPCGAR